MAEDESLLRGLHSSIMRIEQNMATKDDLTTLEQKMATKDDLTTLEQRIATERGDLEEALEQKIATELGHLEEALARPTVARAKGDSYAASRLVRSVQDLVGMLPEAGILKGSEDTLDRCEARRAAENLVVSCLVEEKIPERLLLSLQARLEGGSPRDPWVSMDTSEIDVKRLSQAIADCEDTPLKVLLKRCRSQLQKQGKDMRMKELLLCGSIGLPCVMAAAMPESFLKGVGGSLPYAQLEFDFGGLINISPKQFATIDIGEFKRGNPKFGDAMLQLAIRLRVLKFIVCCTGDLKQDQVVCIGRIFVSRSAFPLDQNRSSLAEDAWKKYGYSLYIEFV